MRVFLSTVIVTIAAGVFSVTALAGATAANMQIGSLADYCRTEILRHNPRHIVGRWPSLGEALVDDEVASEYDCVANEIKKSLKALGREAD